MCFNLACGCVVVVRSRVSSVIHHVVYSVKWTFVLADNFSVAYISYSFLLLYVSHWGVSSYLKTINFL